MVMKIEEEKTITKSKNDDHIIKGSKVRFVFLFDKLELLYWMEIDIPHAVILIL